jgi:Tfp pilus assembly protein FimT
MIVVSLIGMFMLFSIPAYNRFQQSWRLAAESDKMAISLRAARSRAVMKNTEVVFEFDTATNTYSYFDDADGDGTRDSSEYQSAQMELTSGITFQNHTLSGPKITFEPKGNTLESGTIVVQNTRSHTRVLTIYGGTGNVRVD